MTPDPLITVTPAEDGWEVACECGWKSFSNRKRNALSLDAQHRNAHARRAALIEDAEWLAESGVGMTEAARRIGYGGPNGLEKALMRIGRHDLAKRLNDQDWEPLDRYALSRWSA